MKEEALAPIKSYSKTEMLYLYNIQSPHTLNKWIRPFIKPLKKLGYQEQQKIFTVAQVQYLFRDDVLGRPLLK